MKAYGLSLALHCCALQGLISRSFLLPSDMRKTLRTTMVPIATDESQQSAGLLACKLCYNGQLSLLGDLSAAVQYMSLSAAQSKLTSLEVSRAVGARGQLPATDMLWACPQ